MMQELEKYTSSKRSLQVWRMQPWFHTPGLLQGHEALARLLAELLSIGSPNGLKPGVADVVLKIDAQMSTGTKPPVAVIRHPRVRPTAVIQKYRMRKLRVTGCKSLPKQTRASESRTCRQAGLLLDSLCFVTHRGKKVKSTKKILGSELFNLGKKALVAKGKAMEHQYNL